MATKTEQPQTRFLIINADDFGESPEINDGILEAYQKGLVTSASFMANMPGFEHGLAGIKNNPGLDIGVHLNIHRGRPLTACQYLTRDGKFLRDFPLLAMRIYKNRQLAQAEIKAEFEAQIKKVLDRGVRVSHLDTEKHAHVLPPVFKIVLELAEKYKIPFVRQPSERLTFQAALNPKNLHKVALMTICAPLNRRLLQKSTVRSPDYFYGVSISRQFTPEKLTKVFEALPVGVTELSCHPGHQPKVLENYIDKYRAEELETLTNPELKKSLVESGVMLTSFDKMR